MSVWNKIYSRIKWENKPSTNSPINESNLNKMDYALDKLDDRVVELSGYQDRAAESAANAKISEEEASTSASEAKQSASSAAASASKASASEKNAATSEANALTYSKNAADSEQNAKDSENAVALSEQNAKTSETNASTYASNAKSSATEASGYKDLANQYAQEAASSADNAKTNETNSENYANTSKSYAVGETGTRTGEDTDNAKYYYEQTKHISQGLNGIIPMGTVTFANLPTSGMEYGYMYNISDAFASDERFNDGGGVYYGPGNNVIWISGDVWDVIAGSSVTGIKGDAEITYRQGNVNITPEDIGAVPLAGGKMTGLLALYQKLQIIDDGGVTKSVMQLYNSNPDNPTTAGSDITFGAGANMFVGGGESYYSLRNALADSESKLEGEIYTAGGERLYNSADADMFFYSNCNAIADRKAFAFDRSGNLVPVITGQSLNIGTLDKPWNKGYINEVIGNLTGGINVQIVTTTGTNVDDYVDSGIYYFSGSYTPVNIPAGSNGWLFVFTHSNHVKQIWFRYGTGDTNDYHTWIRSCLNGTWYTWRRFITDKDIATTSADGLMSSSDKAILDNEMTYKIAENLLPYPYYDGSSKTVNNVTTTIDENGWAHIKGTSSSATNCFDFTQRDTEFLAGTYTISGVPEGASNSSYRAWLGIYKSGTTTQIKSSQVYADGVTFTVDEPFTMIFRATVSAGVTVDVIYKPMLEVGSVAHPYQPYDLSRQKLRDDTQELHNKTAIFFGDSITWGELGEGDGVQVSNPYPTVFGNVTGCTVINAGARGATASTAYTNNFAAQITAQADNIPNADYAFVCFGVNDFSKAVNVGNASTSTSFYADYLAAIKGILVTNPNIEIIVILPPRGKGYINNANWKNDNGDIFDSYVNATIEIAALLNLRIVDLGKVGINSCITDTFYTDDNHHLTQAGYTLLGEHLAKAYKTGTYETKREFYDRGYRVGTNELGTMPFPNPIDIQGNTYYDGIYWSILGTDTAGITSYKNVQIIKGENHHFEFLTYHRNKANSRTATYTITMTNVSDSTVQYIFKRTLTCTYERLHFDFYANNATGFYNINITVEGDSVYIASPSLSYGGIIPEARKRKIGNVTMSSTNTMTVNRNKFVNGEFIFNVDVTADASTTNLLRVNLNTSNSGDTNAYLPTGNHYFVGVDVTDKKTVPMYWMHDDSNVGQYLLRILSGIESGHQYIANGILYLGANNAVHEIIAQEY